MNSNNKNKIILLIRKLINESVNETDEKNDLISSNGVHKKIIELIERLHKFLYQPKIIIKNDQGEFQIILLDAATDNIIGDFKLDQNLRLWRCGSKFQKTYEIHSNLYHDRLNAGPIFYDIGIEIATILGDGLKTGGASMQAYPVWLKYYTQRNELDIETIQHDSDPDDIYQYKKRFPKNFDGSLPMTPYDYSDDCEIKPDFFLKQNSLIKFDSKTNFEKSPLTKIYRKKEQYKNSVIKYLFNRGILEFENISPAVFNL